MSKNFVQVGSTISCVAPSGGVVGGLAYLLTNLLVVALSTAAVGESFEGKVDGVWKDMPKATGQTWAFGVVLYWDDTAKKFTTTSTSNKRVGVALAAAASGDTVGTVRLDGVSAV